MIVFYQNFIPTRTILYPSAHSSLSHLSQAYGSPQTSLWVKLNWSLMAQYRSFWSTTRWNELNELLALSWGLPLENSGRQPVSISPVKVINNWSDMFTPINQFKLNIKTSVQSPVFKKLAEPFGWDLLHRVDFPASPTHNPHSSYAASWPQSSTLPNASHLKGSWKLREEKIKSREMKISGVMSQGANKLQTPFLANSIYSRNPISKMSINSGENQINSCRH